MRVLVEVPSSIIASSFHERERERERAKASVDFGGNSSMNIRKSLV
jgi:hypothetical protein